MKVALWLAKACPGPESPWECRTQEWLGLLREPAWPELQLPGAGELWEISGCPLKPVRGAQSVLPAVSRKEEQHRTLQWTEHLP